MITNSRVVAVEHLTLDGVYQAPGRTDEDERDGFTHGGWSAGADAPELLSAIGRYMTGGWSLLVGRTTYEDLHEGWPVRQPRSPMTESLTKVQKFVATHDAGYRPIWENTTVLAGDALETVARLKSSHDKTLVIFGSGELVRSLMPSKIVDECLLMIQPLVLGEGRRFFADASLAKLSLVKAESAPNGIILATYRPA